MQLKANSSTKTIVLIEFCFITSFNPSALISNSASNLKIWKLQFTLTHSLSLRLCAGQTMTSHHVWNPYIILVNSSSALKFRGTWNCFKDFHHLSLATGSAGSQHWKWKLCTYYPPWWSDQPSYSKTSWLFGWQLAKHWLILYVFVQLGTPRTGPPSSTRSW
jgi:hypothetical protein